MAACNVDDIMVDNVAKVNCSNLIANLNFTCCIVISSYQLLFIKHISLILKFHWLNILFLIVC